MSDSLSELNDHGSKSILFHKRIRLLVLKRPIQKCQFPVQGHHSAYISATPAQSPQSVAPRVRAAPMTLLISHAMSWFSRLRQPTQTHTPASSWMANADKPGSSMVFPTAASGSGNKMTCSGTRGRAVASRLHGTSRRTQEATKRASRRARRCTPYTAA